MQEKPPKRKEKRITGRFTSSDQRAGKTDWERVAKLGDRQIRRAVRSDPDAAPIADAAWFRRARIVLPEPKQAVSIRLDREVMQWFKQQGPGYQTRINAVLRSYVESQR